jgi:hypothetical protein
MAHARRSLIAGLGVGTALRAVRVFAARSTEGTDGSESRPYLFQLRLLTFLFVFAPFVVRAESAPAEQRVRFTVVSARAAAGLAYVPRTGQAATPLVLYPTARSPRYEYRGAMPLRITDAATKIVVAEATVPSEITEALLLLVPIEPAPATGLRFQTYVLDDSAVRQASGTLSILNLSGFALSGMVGDRATSLATGLNVPVAIARSTAVVLRTTVKNRSLQAYAGTVELRRGERALLVLLPPFYRGSAEVQSRLLIDSHGSATRP